jgi:phenylpyruvate tautomerase PptA (4-oxalocrotonate tautomerase family)
MPLVRISYLKGNSDGFGKQITEIVYRTMTETINVPLNDNFQLITEHEKEAFVYDPSYLDIPRSDGLIFIQITLNEGRSVVMKKAFYMALAERLHKELGIRTEDVFINLIEVKKENWSFGNGIAQYAE